MFSKSISSLRKLVVHFRVKARKILNANNVPPPSVALLSAYQSCGVDLCIFAVHCV